MSTNYKVQSSKSRRLREMARTCVLPGRNSERASWGLPNRVRVG